MAKAIEQPVLFEFPVVKKKKSLKELVGAKMSGFELRQAQRLRKRAERNARARGEVDPTTVQNPIEESLF